MAKQDLDLYFKKIKEDGFTSNIWFFTKQSFKNKMIIYYSYIVKQFEENLSPENFAEFYYRKGLEYEYFSTIKHTVETHRNGVISECLGLVERENGKYNTIKTTPAFRLLDKYIKIPENFEDDNIFFQRQIEKLVVNVNKNLDKYNEVKDVSVFMVMLLYKILLELQKKFGLRFCRGSDVPVLRSPGQNRIPDTSAHCESFISMELKIINNHQHLPWQCYLHNLSSSPKGTDPFEKGSVPFRMFFQNCCKISSSLLLQDNIITCLFCPLNHFNADFSLFSS